jgi:hypothetical protein
VSALVPEDGVRYQAALQFDPPVEASAQTQLESALAEATGGGYQVPTKGSANGVLMGSVYPRVDAPANLD